MIGSSLDPFYSQKKKILLPYKNALHYPHFIYSPVRQKKNAWKKEKDQTRNTRTEITIGSSKFSNEQLDTVLAYQLYQSMRRVVPIIGRQRKWEVRQHESTKNSEFSHGKILSQKSEGHMSHSHHYLGHSLSLFCAVIILLGPHDYFTASKLEIITSRCS